MALLSGHQAGSISTDNREIADKEIDGSATNKAQIPVRQQHGVKPALAEQPADNKAPVYPYFLFLLKAFRHCDLVLSIELSIFHDFAACPRSQIDFLAIVRFEPAMLVKLAKRYKRLYHPDWLTERRYSTFTS